MEESRVITVTGDDDAIS